MLRHILDRVPAEDPSDGCPRVGGGGGVGKEREELLLEHSHPPLSAVAEVPGRIPPEHPTYRIVEAARRAARWIALIDAEARAPA